jgi:hypothetical protein
MESFGNAWAIVYAASAHLLVMLSVAALLTWIVRAWVEIVDRLFGD